MKKKVLFAAIGLLAANLTHAQSNTYQFEGSYYRLSSSQDDDTKESHNAFAGKYYLNPVQIDTSKPLFEAEFLQRASNVGLTYSRISYEDADLVKTTFGSPRVNGTLYVNDFIFGIQNNSSNPTFPTKANTARSVEVKINDTVLKFGYFVLPTTSISFVNKSQKATYSPSAGLAAIKDITITSNGLVSHSVITVANGQHMAFELSYDQIKREQTTSQSNKEYGAAARYYPQTNFYLNAGYMKNSGDYKNNVGSTTKFGAGYAITPRFGIEITTEKFSASDSSLKTSGTTTAVGAGYRF